MARTTVVTKKKRGPPATGKGIQIGERWHAPELAAIDRWIAANGEMTRGQAIRRLVEIGLANGRNTSAKLDQRAAKKASRVIAATAADLKAKN